MKPVKPLFDSTPTAVLVTPVINEVSGIADSKKNAGYIWAEEDGGNGSQLYLIRHDGIVQKRIFIANTVNRDWEEIALSGGDIYIGEIGDNNSVYTEYAFYKFPEPSSTTDTVRNVDVIRFRYTDGPHDAEAFVVDPANSSIYIITKRDNPSIIFKLTSPFSTTTVNMAQPVGQLTYNGVVGAALNANRQELIVKTYFGLNYYKVGTNETIESALAKSFQSLPYVFEPQGEAVSFSTDNSGYFTLSELGNSSEVKLYFYKRN